MELLAILVAALAYTILGFIWYSPYLFGGAWQKLTGIKKMKSTPATMLLAFLYALVMAYVLSSLIEYMGAATLVSGVSVGLVAWLGFIATITMGQVIWERRRAELYLLNNAYNLIALSLMGAILAIWP
jgi:hypothetical protein